jgi:hypothetical protein
LKKLLGDEPSLLLIDEIARYTTSTSPSGSSPKNCPAGSNIRLVSEVTRTEVASKPGVELSHAEHVDERMGGTCARGLVPPSTSTR